MLDWLSTVFQSLFTVWRKLNANCNGGEADFAKHCIKNLIRILDQSLIKAAAYLRNVDEPTYNRWSGYLPTFVRVEAVRESCYCIC
jgi:hypothetical protein